MADHTVHAQCYLNLGEADLCLRLLALSESQFESSLSRASRPRPESRGSAVRRISVQPMPRLGAMKSAPAPAQEDVGGTDDDHVDMRTARQLRVRALLRAGRYVEALTAVSLEVMSIEQLGRAEDASAAVEASRDAGGGVGRDDRSSDRFSGDVGDGVTSALGAAYFLRGRVLRALILCVQRPQPGQLDSRDVVSLSLPLSVGAAGGVAPAGPLGEPVVATVRRHSRTASNGSAGELGRSSDDSDRRVASSGDSGITGVSSDPTDEGFPLVPRTYATLQDIRRDCIRSFKQAQRCFLHLGNDYRMAKCAMWIARAVCDCAVESWLARDSSPASVSGASVPRPDALSESQLEDAELSARVAWDVATRLSLPLILIDSLLSRAEVALVRGTDAKLFEATGLWTEARDLFQLLFVVGTHVPLARIAPASFVDTISELLTRIVRFMCFHHHVSDLLSANLALLDVLLLLQSDAGRCARRVPPRTATRTSFSYKFQVLSNVFATSMMSTDVYTGGAGLAGHFDAVRLQTRARSTKYDTFPPRRHSEPRIRRGVSLPLRVVSSEHVGGDSSDDVGVGGTACRSTDVDLTNDAAALLYLWGCMLRVMHASRVFGDGLLSAADAGSASRAALSVMVGAMNELRRIGGTEQFVCVTYNGLRAAAGAPAVVFPAHRERARSEQSRGPVAFAAEAGRPPRPPPPASCGGGSGERASGEDAALAHDRSHPSPVPPPQPSFAPALASRLSHVLYTILLGDFILLYAPHTGVRQVSPTWSPRVTDPDYRNPKSLAMHVWRWINGEGALVSRLQLLA